MDFASPSRIDTERAMAVVGATLESRMRILEAA
jgi:hypothetical protein